MNGMNRSKTAAELFSTQYNTRSIGLYPYPNYTIPHKKLEKWLYWADHVFVMKHWMEIKLHELYPEYSYKTRNLEINDFFSYNDPFLKQLLEDKVNLAKSC